MKSQNLIIVLLLCVVAYFIFESIWGPIIVAIFSFLKMIDEPVDPKDYFEEE